MSGHSKWSTIKHKKAAKDSKRSKIWTRIIKELTIASRDGGDDVNSNAKLRLAIQNAKGSNMPKDTMERAIKKGAGGDAQSLLEMTFEGYANNGIAVFVECTTDNTNRSVADVRAAFNKNEGNMGTNGSLSFVFDRKGVFEISTESLGERDVDELEMELIEGGLEELERTENGIILYTSFDDFGNMQSALEGISLETTSAELQRIPNNTEVLSIDDSLQVLRFVDKMEEVDDVNTVYHNLEMTDELAAHLASEE